VAPLVASPRLPWQIRVADLYAQLRAAREADDELEAGIVEHRLNRELERHVDDDQGGDDAGA
jgi:DNA-binding FrmR family transcriptional regulator